MSKVRTPEPRILVDAWGGRFLLRVRPCPDGMGTLTAFPSQEQAVSHAMDLSAQHGWPITIGFVDPARFG